MASVEIFCFGLLRVTAVTAGLKNYMISKQDYSVYLSRPV